MPLDPQTGDEINQDQSFFENAKEWTKTVIDKNSKSGRFDSLFGKPLYYPLDLASNDTQKSEVTNWLEFKIYSTKNGGLETVVEKVKGVFGYSAEDLVNQASTSTTSQIDDARGFVQTSEEALSQGIFDEQTSSRVRNAVDERKRELARLLQEKQKYDNTDAKTLSLDVAKGDTLLKDSMEVSSDSVYLYLPGGLDFTDSLKYEEKGFALFKNVTSDISAAGGFAALSLLRKLGGAVDRIGETIGAEDVNTGSFINKQLGIIVNPRKEQMFEGVEFRKFDFAFDFAPKSKKEAEMVRDIIKVFRFHAYPEVTRNKAFFSFPSEFEINAKTYNPRSRTTTRNPAVPRFNRCVLTDIKTNYTPEEVYHAFSDGFPPRIQMTLSFVEADYITRQHISEGY